MLRRSIAPILPDRPHAPEPPRRLRSSIRATGRHSRPDGLVANPAGAGTDPLPRRRHLGPAGRLPIFVRSGPCPAVALGGMATVACDPFRTLVPGPPRCAPGSEAAICRGITGSTASPPCRTLKVAAHPTQEWTSGRSALLAELGRTRPSDAERLYLRASQPLRRSALADRAAHRIAAAISRPPAVRAGSSRCRSPY
jgi:hypothetical protein